MTNQYTITMLGVLLVTAAIVDMRSHRIPNWLSLLGLCMGLALQVLLGGAYGVVMGLYGAAVGLACFMPFYLLRAMGAGDVKLLAAVGAFLGPQGVLYATLFSLLAGGLGALGYLLWRALHASVNALSQQGVAGAATSALVAVTLARRERLPFALPIALGSLTAAWMLARCTGLAACLGVTHP